MPLFGGCRNRFGICNRPRPRRSSGGTCSPIEDRHTLARSASDRVPAETRSYSHSTPNDIARAQARGQPMPKMRIVRPGPSRLRFGLVWLASAGIRLYTACDSDCATDHNRARNRKIYPEGVSSQSPGYGDRSPDLPPYPGWDCQKRTYPERVASARVPISAEAGRDCRRLPWTVRISKGDVQRER
jgi:hypothetical protein